MNFTNGFAKGVVDIEVFKLIGTIAVKGADTAEQAIDGLSNKGGSLGKVFSGLGNLAEKGMKVAAGAIAGASTAVGGLVAKSVSAYAEFEQLAGGVETLFKDSAELVMKYADNAYKTAGLSANDYMETVTSFSASLLQSLGGDTEKAAKAADMAVTDMADNMNKMGSSMESIQNAYQGFAKQNYTMLDNLKLGYGGTKEEMQRLLEDAEKLSGVKYDISNLNDVYNAIHVVQTELGITGTTAKEAEETISGSFASMKSALDNLITGFGDKNADIDKLFGNFLDSADIFLNNNLIPTVERILDTLIKKIPEFAPKLINSVTSLLSSIAPSLAESGMELVRALFNSILDLIPGMTDDLKERMNGALDDLFDSLKDIFDFISDIADDVLPVIINAGGIIIKGIGNLTRNILPPLSKLLTAVCDILEPILDILSPIVDLITELTGGLIGGVIDVLARLFGYNEHDELVKKFSALSSEEQAVIDKTKELSDEQDNLNSTLKNGFQGIDGTYLKYDNLIDKLDTMVDSEGRVKEGYEKQVEYILNELNSAFGTEMEMVDGVIQKYQEEKQTLEDLMTTKKAQAYLNSAEDEYTEALQKQSEVQQNYAEAVNKYNNCLKEKAKAEEEAERIASEIRARGGIVGGEEWTEANAKVEGLTDKLEELSKTKREASLALSNNSAIVQNFENMTVAIAENDIPKINEAMENMSSNFIDAQTGTKEALADQTEDFRKAYDDILAASKVKGSKITQTQVDNARRMYERSLAEWSKLSGMSANELERVLNVVYSKESSFVSAGNTLSSSFVDGFLDKINSSASTIANVMQSVVDSAAAGVVVTVPSVSSSGTYTGKINSPSDLRLAGHAKGGIVTREHIARVGEDGAEAIIPLEHNTEWIDKVANRINSTSVGNDEVLTELRSLNNNIKNMKIYLDGKTLVGSIAGDMDKRLGSIARQKRRAFI